MRVLVTGGAGFIGRHFIQTLFNSPLSHGGASRLSVLNLDALHYAAWLQPRGDELGAGLGQYCFKELNLCDQLRLNQVVASYQPQLVVHFAAHTHVDNSIDSPLAFVHNNTYGTFCLLQACLSYWQDLSDVDKESFKYIQISTDEVYGSLKEGDPAWVEGTAFAPNNPYAASKASADHLAMAWHNTWGFPVIITHCCNNYGTCQHPEKLIPRMIKQALLGEPMPIYGSGLQRREWLYVDDHCQAVLAVLLHGQVGQRYHIGSGDERSNIDVVHQLCEELERIVPCKRAGGYERLISHIPDRLGHDQRYRLNFNKIQNELGWQPTVGFEQGLARTVEWYVDYFLQTK